MHPQPTVAVVEDDDGVRAALRLLITNANYLVKTYRSAEAFWTDHRDDPPHCLLLDAELPGKSGIDLLQDLASRGSEYPVIMMSGSLDPFTPIRARRLGAIDYFEKPFDAYRLLNRVQQALGLDSPSVTSYL